MQTVDFLGPMGGALAVAFGLGWLAGYAHAAKTSVKEGKERIVELKKELADEKAAREKDVKDLTDRIRSLEDQRFDLAREK